MSTAILFGLMILLILVGIPIGITIGVATAVVMAYTTPMPLMVIAQKACTGLDSFPLLGVPFFILAGSLMCNGGISKRLIDLAESLVGYIVGGLAMVTVMACMFFAAISGSGPATVSAIGSFMIPAMKERHYGGGFAAAVTAAAGTIGVIIPPSIPFVIYCIVAQVSIGDMFIAGIVPGIIIGIALMGTCYLIARKRGYVSHAERVTTKDVMINLREALWALMVPVIILGGIYSGVFTPTEAAGVAVVYGLIVGMFVYREIKPRHLGQLFMESAVGSATVMFIVACAGLFTYTLSVSGVAVSMSDAILSVSQNKLVLMLIINVIFLIAGCFVDANSAFYILIPITMPIARHLNIDPVHLGVFLTVNLAIGQITPPVGVNLYAAAAVGNISAGEIIRKITPFIICGIIALMIITYIPQLTMLFVNIL